MKVRVSIVVSVTIAVLTACSADSPAVGDPLVVATATTTSPATTSPASTTAAAADPALQTIVDEFVAEMTGDIDLGGIVVALAEGDHWAIAAGGTQPDGSPVPPGGAWRIGSVTKPFVATAVLQLVDANVVDLCAPVTDYLEIALPGSITVRDLLQHTSGIFNYTEDLGFVSDSFAEPSRVWTPDELIQRALQAREVEQNPTWAYSNTNYLILGRLIESVTGKTADEVLRTGIVEPLGLDATYLAGAEQGPEPISAFTAMAGPDVPVDGSLPYASVETGAWTAGALVSDADDLVTFVRALFGGELISTASLSEMTMAVDGGGYGLGIEVVSGLRTEMWGHGGAIPGYLTSLSYSPDRDLALVVGLTYDAPRLDLQARIHQLLVRALTG